MKILKVLSVAALMILLFFSLQSTVLAAEVDCEGNCETAATSCKIQCDGIDYYNECMDECDYNQEQCFFSCNEDDQTSDEPATPSGCDSFSGTETCVDESLNPPTVGESTTTGLPKCTVPEDYEGGGLFAAVSDDCAYCGNCELCDFLTVANQIARLIFGIFGGVAFLMFLWGGGGLVLAAGNAEKIKENLGVLKAALIGMLIIILAWQIVHILLIILSNDPSPMLFGKPWDNPCS